MSNKHYELPEAVTANELIKAMEEWLKKNPSQYVIDAECGEATLSNCLSFGIADAFDAAVRELRAPRPLPGIIVEMMAGGMNTTRQWMRDYRQCVIEQAIADRACTTWPQTVDRYASFVEIHRDMERNVVGWHSRLADHKVYKAPEE